MSQPSRPFRATGNTSNIDVSSSSQEVAVGSAAGGHEVRVMNNGSATAWIGFGVTGVTASLTADIPVGPGVTEVFRVPPLGTATFARAIAAGSTGKVYFTPGSGI